MRTGPLLGLVGFLLGSVAATSSLQGQSRTWGAGAGGGVTFPAGAYASSDDPGANVLMYFWYAPVPAVALGLDVGGIWTPHKSGGHTELYEILLGAAWRLGAQAVSVRPYLLGCIGAVGVETDNPEKSRFAFGGGAGVSLGHGDARFFVQARFIQVQASGGALRLVPLTVGFATRAP